MSTTIYFDSDMDDDARRARLYAGDIFVYSARQSVLDFAAFARQMVEEAFGTLDPEIAQYHMPVEQYAELLGQLKPAFIHHPESKSHLKAIFTEFGCDLEKTYFDVPRLRSSTSDDYLTSGIAYAWHPHRDTWYSAPPCQINWWLPVYGIQSENAMAFHPAYWNRAVPNNSETYNYYAWNQLHRGASVTAHIKQDPRPLPRATGPMDVEPQYRLICPVGGVILFSAAQMHSSVPNTSGVTRFSVDFRHVHRNDVEQRIGAPRSDEACTGTTMRDYHRAVDLEPLPDELIALYDDDTGMRGKLVYEPDA